MSEPPPTPDGPRPDYRLYTPGQVACGTFFGTILAGCYMLFRNARNLGLRGWPYLAAAIPVLAVSWFLPQGVGGGLALAIVFGLRGLAQSEFGSALQVHQARGGATASNWSVFGISMGSIVMVVGLCLVPVLFDEVWAQTHHVESVVYRPGVDEDAARKVAGVMHDYGLITEKESWDVTLRRRGEGYALDMPLQQDAWKDPKSLEFGTELATELTQKLGAPTVVCFTDEYGELQATQGPK